MQVVYNGMFTPTEQAVNSASPFYLKGFEPAPRDIEKAKALVKQSGVPTPITVEMMVPNSPDVAQEAEVIQSMVHDAGFDVKIRLIELVVTLSGGAGRFPGLSADVVRAGRSRRQSVCVPARGLRRQRWPLCQFDCRRRPR